MLHKRTFVQLLPLHFVSNVLKSLLLCSSSSPFMTPSHTNLAPPAHGEFANADPTAAERKQDHIELAFKSQVSAGSVDLRFDYEPMLSAHPKSGSLPTMPFLGKTLRCPIWVSSMTGGTAHARTINHNLARACNEFGMGMGLGSCRQLLYGEDYLADFDVRDIMGPDVPLFANLGVAQIEQLLEKGDIARLSDMVEKLRADGLIIHVNPLQESMQPEGDAFKQPPLETIQALIEAYKGQVIVKEVGQGFGPASMRALLTLPLAALEFAAAGGTNFAKLELLRSEPEKMQTFEQLAAVGHTALDMLGLANSTAQALGNACQTKSLIISGGIRNFLDGYFLIQSAAIPAVYGQASGFLQHAIGDYKALQTYTQAQIRGLELAFAFLSIKALPR
jgi:isopentenyl-diphosphate delta-isomerase